MDDLVKLLSELSHLNLEGHVVNKQVHASGFGGSCDVYSAWSTRHGKKVAVKQIRAFMRKDESFAKRLAREICIWATLNHPNVLPLLGYLAEGENMTPSLISEWMLYGTLHEYMKLFPRCGEETCIMVQLYGIASGLSYLHTKGIIHADLKSQNVLISAKGIPLLADFGLSLVLSQSQSALGTTASYTRGTVRWMAKELFFSSSDGDIPKHTTMTDIWAFGMIAYELLSWKIPYSDKRPDHIVMLSIMKGELPEKPDSCGDNFISSKLWALCDSCWSEISSRPTAYKIMAYLAFVNKKVQSEYVLFLDQLVTKYRKEAGSSIESTQVSASRIAYERQAAHYTLFTWAPTPRKLDTTESSNAQSSAASAWRPVLAETDVNLPLVIHNPIPISMEPEKQLRSQTSSPQLPDLSFLKDTSSGPANAYVKSVMSELFSWSSSLADANEHLYEF